MSDRELGFAVIEWNQASDLPAILGPLTDTIDESRTLLAGYAEETARFGRRERYSVARLVEVEEGRDE